MDRWECGGEECSVFKHRPSCCSLLLQLFIAAISMQVLGEMIKFCCWLYFSPNPFPSAVKKKVGQALGIILLFFSPVQICLALQSDLDCVMDISVLETDSDGWVFFLSSLRHLSLLCLLSAFPSIDFLNCLSSQAILQWIFQCFAKGSFHKGDLCEHTPALEPLQVRATTTADVDITTT